MLEQVTKKQAVEKLQSGEFCLIRIVKKTGSDYVKFETNKVSDLNDIDARKYEFYGYDPEYYEFSKSIGLIR